MSIYKYFFEHFHLPIIISDFETDKIIGINKKVLTLMGKAEDDFYRLKRTDILPLKAIKGINNSVKETFSASTETFIIHKDGYKIPVIINASLIKENDNEILIEQLSRKDKPEFYLNEDLSDLKQSESMFRSLVEESLVGVYIIQNGKFPYVNPRLAEIFGYTADEITGIMKIEDFVYEPDREKVIDNIQKRLSGNAKTLHYTFRGVRKDSSVIQIEVMGSKTIFNGEPAVIGTLLDITERKLHEEELRKLSQAIEQNPVSIIITDTEGNIEYVNPRFCKLTGYAANEVIGKNPRILKSGDKPPTFYQNLWKTIKEGEEWTGEFRNQKKNGELFWEFASISPIKNSAGETTHFLAVKEDITDRKKVENELKAAKEKAEEMSRLKSIFLANMSHELRTPMVAILGYSEILKNEIDNRDLKTMSLEIYESSKRLLNTLNLILDLSRIEANKTVINLNELDVNKIAADEFNVYKNLAEKKKIDYKIFLPDKPLAILTDERIFRQIINNLLSNAVKFTNKGGVTLTVSAEQAGKAKNIIIKVSDTGIGIPRDSIDLIFAEFRQISEGLNRAFEGAGLGLTITKKFVDMLNGRIDVDSQVGKGSTFTVRLPLLTKANVQFTELEPSIESDPNQIKIEFSENIPAESLPQLLLIEDDPSNAGVIKFFLAGKYNLDMVSTGEEGIEFTKRKNYDAILMDIDLGFSISGLEAVKRIRELPGYADKPIIAVTALAMKGDKERFLAEGCTHYLAKPFKKEQLLNIIKEALEDNDL
jgi:PAS domain S-box-containing protein